MRTYELRPNNGQKSFNGAALVYIYEDGTEILRSYNTNAARRTQEHNANYKRAKTYTERYLEQFIDEVLKGVTK